MVQAVKGFPNEKIICYNVTNCTSVSEMSRVTGRYYERDTTGKFYCNEYGKESELQAYLLTNGTVYNFALFP